MGVTLALAVVLVATPLPVRAQDGSAAASEREARELFERGAAALVDGRFTVARDLLRQSLELHPGAPAAFNLAVALRGTGQTIEAIALFESLLDRAYGPLDPERLRQVQTLLADTRTDIAVIRIAVDGPLTAQIELDGERVATPARGEVLEQHVDAGRHVVSARASGWQSAEQRVDVPRSGASEVRLHLVRSIGPAAVTATGTPPPTTAHPEPGGVLSSPWFWLGTGAAVIAAVTLGVVLAQGDGISEPYRDPTFGIIVTLH